MTAGARLLARRAGAAVGLGLRAAPGCSAVVLALAVAQGIAGPATAWCTKLLLDEVARGEQASGGRLLAATAVLAGITLLLALQAPVGRYAGAVLHRAVRREVMDRLFRRVNAIPGLAPFEDPAVQDRLRLAEQAGDQAPQEVSRAGVEVVRSVVAVVGFASVLLAVWPPMLALVLVAAVPGVMLQLSLGRRTADLAAELTGNLRRQFFYRTLLTEPRAAKEVRLFGIGDFLRGRLVRDLRAADRAENALERRGLLVGAGLEGAAAALQVVGVAVAVYQAFQGRLGVGDVAAFLAAVVGVQAALAGLSGALAEGYQALLLFGHFHDLVLDGAGPAPAGRQADPLRRGIEVRDVWFRYSDDGPWVLRGVDLDLRRGGSVGLVGLNGAGKSTLVKLLCGFYTPQRGTIRWDGVDLRDLDPASLRRRIGAVFQDYLEYDLTAAENIGVGRVDELHDRAAVERAAELAGVHAVLRDLPAGYDTMLSRLFVPEDAGTAVSLLSGGQWQRVALARAVRRADADLFVLDEPTAGLDAEAEHAVHQRVAALRRDRTSLLISHRLGALRDADRIVVLDGGRVAEQGSHAELLAAGGVYARLFRLQARGYAGEPEAGSPEPAGSIGCDGSASRALTTATTAWSGRAPNTAES